MRTTHFTPLSLTELWSAMAASPRMLQRHGLVRYVDPLGTNEYAVALAAGPKAPFHLAVSSEAGGQRIWLIIRHPWLRHYFRRRRVTALMVLSPISKWETRVDVRLCLRPTGLWGTLTAPLLRLAMKRAVARYMTVLESQGPHLLYGPHNAAA